MQLHTRVVLKAYNTGDMFVRRSEDFGIPYHPDHSKVKDHEKVRARIADLKRFYEVVELSMRDTN